jgi:predicted MPP superfamily phosphohydrolase
MVSPASLLHKLLNPLGTEAETALFLLERGQVAALAPVRWRMRIQLLSDLHTEDYEFPVDFLSGGQVQFPGADVLALCGDIVAVDGQGADEVRRVFEFLSRQAKHVFFVPGNHEYWGTKAKPGTAEYTERIIRSCIDKLPNMQYLNNDEVVTGGVHFLAGTMWFPDHPLNQLYEKHWPDFENIARLTDWVYEYNRAFVELADKATPGTVVLTHHLPTEQSVAPHFRESDWNRFFVCDMSRVITERKPRLWLHGHTHCSLDYRYEATRVICNPFGYSWERNANFATTVVDI